MIRASSWSIVRLRSLPEGSPSAGPMVMASFVGLATGLAAVAFDELITGVDAVLFDWWLGGD